MGEVSSPQKSAEVGWKLLVQFEAIALFIWKARLTRHHGGIKNMHLLSCKSRPRQHTQRTKKQILTDGGRTDGRTDGWNCRFPREIKETTVSQIKRADGGAGAGAKLFFFSLPTDSPSCRPSVVGFMANFRTFALSPLPGQILRRRVDSYGKATSPDVNVTSSAPRI